MTADHIDRAAEVIEDVIGNVSDVDDIAQALDAAGLLTAPEHDAVVAVKALREAADELEGTGDIIATLGSVAFLLRVRADLMEAGESDADA